MSAGLAQPCAKIEMALTGAAGRAIQSSVRMDWPYRDAVHMRPHVLLPVEGLQHSVALVEEGS
jgi:hypothetical protein